VEPESVRAMSGELNFILITTIAGIVTTILTTFVSIYRENRNRKWDLEDRRTARDEQRNLIVENTAEQTKVLSTMIDENTELSKKAFTEANNFNNKLIALANQFDALPITPKEPVPLVTVEIKDARVVHAEDKA